MKESSINIYLGDLCNNYRSYGPFTFPLNLGTISVHAQKFYKGGAKLNFKLFKFPGEMIEAARENPPDIIGLANYTWNYNLNIQLLKLFKKEFPKVTTLMGGPSFNTFDMEKYFLNRPYLDYFVVNQGETGLLNIINYYTKNELPHQSKESPIINNVAYYDHQKKKVTMGNINERYSNLDEIPSPYLEGVLDKFFDVEYLIPLTETMRGCPFKCTFCGWGDEWLRKANQYSLGRIKSELEYIAQRSKHSSYFYLADSNFGMHRRDQDIAKIIRDCYDNYGWPQTVWTQWAKNSSERVIGIAETLGSVLGKGITIAYESMDQNTLKNVKRANISLDKFNEVRKHIKLKGLRTHTDLILGLPGETKESYLNGLRNVFKQGFDEIVTFNCQVLEGTEMAKPEYLKEHGIKTKYRMLDKGFGIYSGQTVIETEKIITETNSMTEKEIIDMRPVNFFVFLLWNSTFYLETMKFMLSLQINPIDFILKIDKDLVDSSDDIGKLLTELRQKTKDELFDTQEQLFKKYSEKDKDGKMLADKFSKLNHYFTAKILFKHKAQMDQKIFEVISEMINERFEKKLAETYISQLKEIIDYNSRKLLNMKEYIEGKKPQDFSKSYSYDFIKWMSTDKGERPISEFNGGAEISFYLSKERSEKINSQIKNHKFNNPVETFMKMLEMMRQHDFFMNTSSSSVKKTLENQVEKTIHTSI